MKKILILTVIFLVSVNMIGQNFFSQQLVSSGGDQTDNATYKTSWSIGEPITETATAGAYTLTQGFQQNIYPQLVAGTISASQAICYNTAPAQLTSTPPTGGNTPYTYQWQNSPNGTIWTNITGATSQNYQPPALTATTWYRLYQISASGAGTVTTNPVTITVYPNLVAGTASANQSICYNTTPGLLTGTAPTGGNIPYTYQWQNSPNGTIWTNITGATSLTYQPPVLTVTTYYRLNQSSASGCGTVSTNMVTITILPLPVPTIIGPASVCANTTGNVYSTQTGMTNYVWTVSAGGTITAGGTSTSSTVTVTWNTAGAKTVSVIYTNSSGCTAAPATVYNVTVNPLPLPIINIYNNNPCPGSTGNQFYTEPGMTNYVWSVTSGGQITAGQGTVNVTVTWNTPGLQTLSVIYTSASGCTTLTPGTYLTMVNPLPNPAGNITGSSSVCAGANGVAYSIAPVANASSYAWTLPAGATIATGSGTTSITVNYSANATSGNISVSGVNQCGNGTPSSLAVTVNPLPAAAGTITGDESVCQGDMGVSYSVASIAGVTGYIWTVPAGATIASGANTNHITVNFSASASSGVITVHGVNACGSGASSPDFNVAVYPIPPTPVITQNGNILTSSASAGNQWYFNGTAIPGATSQTYEATASGDYYVIITLDGCSSDPSNIITVIMTGINNLSEYNLNIYPVPNDGRFTISFIWPTQEFLTLEVYNYLGVRIHEFKVQPIQRKAEKTIDLRPIPNGVYTVVLRTEDNRVIRKILVNK